MSNSNILIERVTSIINSANSIVEKMQDGERIQIKNLTAQVAGSSFDPKEVLAIVSMFARNTDLGYVSRGKNGGLIRGAKPAQKPPAQKASPSKKAEDVSDIDSDEDIDADDDFDSDDE